MEKEVERFDCVVKFVSECFPTHAHALDAIICALQAQNSPMLDHYIKTEKLDAVYSHTQKVCNSKHCVEFPFFCIVDFGF